MTYQQIFKDVRKYFIKANTSHFTQEFAFQFNITGEGEGIFYAAYKNGVLAVEPYDYVDRDTIFEADGKTLKDIAAGKLEVIDAIKEGKMAVDGNHEAAKQIMFLCAAKKADEKKDAKPAAKKAEKPAAKKAEKPAAKAAPKSAVKTEAKPAAKEAPKANIKEAVKPAVKEAAKPVAKEAPKPAVKEAPKAVVKEAVKPVVKEAPKPAVKEAPKAAVKEAPKTDKKK